MSASAGERKPSLSRKKPKVALVLGSGAARGWAHIGVIHELAEMGIRPDIVVGASVGAVVGGALASGNLATFEEWVLSLGRVDIIRLLDAKMTGGGFLQGKSLMGAIGKQIGDPKIEELDIPFACVATELGSGRELWLREGSLLDACRASIALPGMFAPSRDYEDRLLVDGGLVERPPRGSNPGCRARRVPGQPGRPPHPGRRRGSPSPP